MLPAAFLERMKRLLGDEYEAFLASYDRPRNTGLRLNPHKAAGAPPFCAERVPWERNGFYLLPDVRPGLHPYHDAGLYYLQEPSAMAPASAIQPPTEWTTVEPAKSWKPRASIHPCDASPASEPHIQCPLTGYTIAETITE